MPPADSKDHLVAAHRKDIGRNQWTFVVHVPAMEMTPGKSKHCTVSEMEIQWEFISWWNFPPVAVDIPQKFSAKIQTQPALSLTG